MADHEDICEILTYVASVFVRWLSKVSCQEFVNQVGNMDPIANMLVSIRNAQAVQKKSVIVPYSIVKHKIANILLDEGFLSSVQKQQQKDNHPTLSIVLKYKEDGKGAIVQAKRMSTPGRRMYAQQSDIRPVKNGIGVSIISTSKGLMTGKKARQEKVGGEILCHVW